MGAYPNDLLTAGGFLFHFGMKFWLVTLVVVLMVVTKMSLRLRETFLDFIMLDRGLSVTISQKIVIFFVWGVIIWLLHVLIYIFCTLNLT